MIIKSSMTVVFLVIALFVVGSGQASADKRLIKAYKSDGSLNPITYTWRKKGSPFVVTAILPNGFVAGKPTKVILKYRYVNARFKIGRPSKKTTFRKEFRKKKMSNAKITVHSNWWNVNSRGFDSFTQKKRVKAIAMNRTRTVVLWLMYSCNPLDQVYLASDVWLKDVKAPWQCMPPGLAIDFEASISGKRTFVVYKHYLSVMGMFVYPSATTTPSPEPSPPPVSEAPPASPTGPTGSSGPTGPTG